MRPKQDVARDEVDEVEHTTRESRREHTRRVRSTHLGETQTQSAERVSLPFCVKHGAKGLGQVAQRLLLKNARPELVEGCAFRFASTLERQPSYPIRRAVGQKFRAPARAAICSRRIPPGRCLVARRGARWSADQGDRAGDENVCITSIAATDECGNEAGATAQKGPASLRGLSVSAGPDAPQPRYQ
jgi:hypothetical protein